jgi:hypothetical protein
MSKSALGRHMPVSSLPFPFSRQLYTSAVLSHPLFSLLSFIPAMRSFATILLALSLSLHAFAAHDVNHRRHAEIALRPRQGTNARMTYYDITTGTYVYLYSTHIVYR